MELENILFILIKMNNYSDLTTPENLSTFEYNTFHCRYVCINLQSFNNTNIKKTVGNFYYKINCSYNVHIDI